MKGDVAVKGEVLVSVDAVVEADIRAGSIGLGGQIQGNLSAPGDISLPPKSRVEGDVVARNVMVHGAINGNVVAQGRVELGEAAMRMERRAATCSVSNALIGAFGEHGHSLGSWPSQR